MRPTTEAQFLAKAYLRALAKSTPLGLRARVLLEGYHQLTLQLSEQVAAFSRPEPSQFLLGQLAQSGALDDELKQAILAFVQLKIEEPESRVSAAHRLGELLDLLLASEKTRERKKLGSYYTPPQVARQLVARSFGFIEQVIATRLATIEARGIAPTGAPSALAHELSYSVSSESAPLLCVCDPACGGGAFLVEAVRAIAHRLCELNGSEERAWTQALGCAFGIDVSELAIATAQASLHLLAPAYGITQSDHFRVGDALIDEKPGVLTPQLTARAGLLASRLDVKRAFSRVFEPSQGGFDWIVGNPPWVAFQGRATQPISPQLRAFYRARYHAFEGYPTTQGMFVERATELAERGVISLLVPSSLSDLDGYAPTRRAVTLGHTVAEPLLEFGQDAFAQVVQPCFGLVAMAKSVPGTGTDHPFQLEERARAAGEAAAIDPPTCILDIAKLPPLPAKTFGELGFQSNSAVVRTLFKRTSEASAPFTVGLLEGRCVHEFSQTLPRVFINPDKNALREVKARLREPEVYQAVDFVVRQTASFTIAARHAGQYFRNSLIAGYASAEFDTDLLVGLLNSALYRCLHLSSQRDARQATFPQVKVSHLRRLPAPPLGEALRSQVRKVSQKASESGGLSSVQRAELDGAVFRLFGLSTEQCSEIISYLQAREVKALAPSHA